ncbi:unnamed protein product [Calypogeia fissa]
MGRSRGPLADDDGAWFGHRSKRRRIVPGVDSLDSGATGDGKRPPLYHCNYCHKDISGTIRIKCDKCPDYDLCVECFSVGAETYPHKCNHPYRVMDNLAFPLIHPDWNADEEILLLEAVEMCGVGNWGDVGEHVGTKTKAQCYEHYMTAYMNSPFSPLPDMRQVMGKSRTELLAIAKMQGDGKKNAAVGLDPLRLVKQEPTISPARIKIEEIKESPSGRSPSGLLGSKDGKLEGDQGEGSSGVPITSTKKTVGGQAKESLDSQGTANAEEGQSNRSLGGKKPKPLAEEGKAGIATAEQTGYNAKRQEFDPEYDNDAELQLADMEFKDNDTETDRELKLRILHIYFARLDERKRRGDFVITRGLTDQKKQAALDRKRTKDERDLYQRARIFMRYHSNEEHEALLSGWSQERRTRQRIEELQELRSAGCRLLADGELYFSEKKKKDTEVPVKKARDGTTSLQGGKVTHRSYRYMKRETGDGEPSPSGDVRSSQKPRSSGHHSHSSGNVKGVKKSAMLPDLTGYPGMEMLSLSEQELCQQCRLLPSHYLKMKEVLMFESMRKGQVRRSDAYGMFRVDPIKTDKVYELLMKMEFIQGDGPAPDRKFNVI